MSVLVAERRIVKLGFVALAALAFALLAPVANAQSSQHSVALSWGDSSDASAGYNIYRLDGACPSSTTTGSGTKLTASPLVAGTTSYTDSGLAPGTYCYYATAVLNGAESVPSNLAPAVVLPAPPSSLTVTQIK